MPADSKTGGERMPLTAGAGRYRIDGVIASGGVGRVYAATDLSTERRVALKRVLDTYADSVKVQTLFKLEYHTLKQIDHPRVIKVFDYGVDAEGPYYTMEMLEGLDLHDLSPMKYRQACVFLRDVAFSLALLHTRRLLHRDLSPRNVRATGDGHCKLLDFGTMATFGVTGEVAGTPPLVAPESLRGMPLDHRADLYSLGALAYWVLTRQHAFRARRLEDLHTLFTKAPPPPSSIAPGIPREMDRLVMSLLSLDPMSRPASAAEVIERLDAIGGLQKEPGIEHAQSYLLGSPLVGRRREMERLLRKLSDALQGRGDAVMVESNPGVGKTRLLEELSLQAQMGGALVVRVESRSNRGHYGVARALALSLLRTAPEEASEALQPFRFTLGHLLPELRIHPDRLAALSEDIKERRMAVQSALLSWLVLLSQDRPLVVLVDDIHRADEDSAAFMASLAIEAEGRYILVVATRVLWAIATASGALRSLSASARRLRLHRLRSKHTAEMVRAMFGEVPNADRIAKWMHSISTGNPAQNMALARHLVDSGTVHYAEGIWVLPEEVSGRDVPYTLASAMLARARSLSPPARALAEALSVRRGVIPLEHCLTMAGRQDENQAFQALEELIGQGVLESAGGGYRFCQEPFREALFEGLDPDRRRALHLAYGRSLLQTSSRTLEEEIEAGWHLLHGGDETRGAELVAATSERLALEQYNIAAAVPAVEAALDVYKRQGRSPAERLRLLARLVRWSTDSDRSDLADRYGEKTVRALYQYSGMQLASRLRRVLGGWLAVWLALGLAGLRNLLTPRHRRGPPARKALRLLCACLASLFGVKAIFLDSEGIRRLVHYARPLRGFGENNPAFATYLYCRGNELHHLGRFDVMSRLFERLTLLLNDENRFPALTPDERRSLLVGALIPLGIYHAMAGRKRALELAEKLERYQTKLGELAAHRVRMVYHLYRGERELAAEHLARVERHGIQGGSTWQVEFFFAPVNGLASSIMLDLIGLKQSLKVLERLARQAPSIRPLLDMLRVPFLVMRGETAEALFLSEQLIEALPPWKSVAWLDARSGYAYALNSAGEHEKAWEVCRHTLSILGKEKGSYASYFTLILQLAVAELGLGNQARAVEILQGLIEENQPNESPLFLGRCHHLLALVALSTGDQESYQRHLAEMRRWFAATDNPVLLAEVRQVEEGGGAPGVLTISSIPPPGPGHDAITAVQAPADPEWIESLFEGCENQQQRARRALEKLLREAAVDSGYLYLVDAEGLRLAAAVEAEQPDEAIEQLVRFRIDEALESSLSTDFDTQGSGSRSSSSGLSDADGSAGQRVQLLTGRDGARSGVIGAVVLHPGDAPPDALVSRRVLEAVGRRLMQAGDAELNPDFQDDAAAPPSR